MPCVDETFRLLYLKSLQFCFKAIPSFVFCQRNWWPAVYTSILVFSVLTPRDKNIKNIRTILVRMLLDRIIHVKQNTVIVSLVYCQISEKVPQMRKEPK